MMSIFDDVDELFGEEEQVEKANVEQNTGVATNADAAPVDAQAEKNTPENNTSDGNTPENNSPAEIESENGNAETAVQPAGQATEPPMEDKKPTNLFGEQVEESCGCATSRKKPKGAGKNNNNGSKTKAAKVEKPKEPEHDLERMIVITAQNEQRIYPPELTLEQIREELERDFPAFSKENTNWHFEKQEDKDRYLCIPTYKFSKAG